MAVNIGDLVQLKSGGPVMTVVRVHKMENPLCAWFANGDYNSAIIPEGALHFIDQPLTSVPAAADTLRVLRSIAEGEYARLFPTAHPDALAVQRVLLRYHEIQKIIDAD